MRLKILNALHDSRLESRRARFPGKITRRPVIAGRPLAPHHSRVLEDDALTEKVCDELISHQRVGLVRTYILGRPGGEADMVEVKAELHPESGEPAAEKVVVVEPAQPSDDSRTVEAMIFVAGQTAEWRVEALARTQEGSEGWFIEDDWGLIFVPVPEDPDARAEFLGETPEGDDEEPDPPTAEEPTAEEPTAEEPTAEEPTAEEAPLLHEEVLPEEVDPALVDDFLDEEPEEESSVEEFTLPEDLEGRLRTRGVVTNDELRGMLSLFGGPVAGKNKDTLVSDIMAAASAPGADPVMVNKVLSMLAEAEQ